MNEKTFLQINEIKKIPENSGVYEFYNKKKEIIYIGKAKNLRKRVGSYFKKTGKNIKTYSLVKNISFIKYTVLNNEHEAFLLENNLIKKNKPRYNILLKDSKTYPFIIITDEHFPKIECIERIEKKYKYIFGPFSDRIFMHEISDFVKKFCKIRSCKYCLSKEDIDKKKHKVCLEYHLKNCCGICENFISYDEYMKKVNEAINILNGNFGKIKKNLKKKMFEYAKKEEYMLAQKCKEDLEKIENYERKSVVTNIIQKDFDVFYVEKDVLKIYSSYLIVRGGLIIFIKNDVFENSNIGEILRSYREKCKSESKIVISNVEFDAGDGIEIKKPKIGDKKKLLEICKKNIDNLKHEIKIKETMVIDFEKILEKLKYELKLKKIPMHIECFDNSNLQGTNAVSSCVVFKNGEPSKEDYRKFIVKTVTGADDFKTMEEVIFRRYRNMKNEDLPDLIIVDGGRGQLNSAVKVLKKLKILEKIDIIGLAKEFEEVFFYDKIEKYMFEENSETLYLVQNIRNEAHRFAINFHRKRRSRNMLK